MDIISVARSGRAGRSGDACESAAVTFGAATSLSPEYSNQTPISYHGIILYDRLNFCRLCGF